MKKHLALVSLLALLAPLTAFAHPGDHAEFMLLQELVHPFTWEGKDHFVIGLFVAFIVYLLARQIHKATTQREKKQTKTK